jgi:beta-aspartyl-peptidase (threonine type)
VKRIALAVHGGAGNISGDALNARRRGIQPALERGWAVLRAGGSAIDACEQAIIALEDDPAFDAGIGSYLNRDGKVQLDAILMDGVTLKSGAVAAVECIRNPIRLARLILERSPHMFIVGAGAEQFATENSLPLCDPRQLITDRALELWRANSGTISKLGTVGAVALDANGNLAAGTSTGGTAYKYPGRVGDSPLVGCGCYADNLSSAASATGDGEAIMRVLLTGVANHFVQNGKSAQEAADAAIAVLAERTAGRGGLIIIDHQGRVGAAFSTAHMTYAFRTLEPDSPH